MFAMSLRQRRLLRLALAAIACACLASLPSRQGWRTIARALDTHFDQWVIAPLKSLFFFDIMFWRPEQVPLIVAWLTCGAVYFTLRFRFVNVRAFGHAWAILVGTMREAREPGQVSHFQALSSALSATIGLGNIGGVAVAVAIGGPGATLWMVVAGFLGMSSKFVECTLSQMYRRRDAEGNISGGPMHYLADGIGELGGRHKPLIGRGLAVAFCMLCIPASLGAGSMFQAKMSYAQVASQVPAFANVSGAALYGLLLALCTGLVIVGGIQRIGAVAGVLVPCMCAVYLVAGWWVLWVNRQQLDDACLEILHGAVRPDAAYGGVVGVMITGLRRAAFSNEAGVGSSPIAHAAASTKEPVREGIVALLEPFLDTVLVCSTTALVVVVTGAHHRKIEGVVMTSYAFASVLPWFPYILSGAVVLFAFSTMISWSYYGDRCWAYLFGVRYRRVFPWIFLASAVLGTLLPLGSVIDFSDLMMLGMAFLNVPGLIILAPKVEASLRGYWSVRPRSG